MRKLYQFLHDHEVLLLIILVVLVLRAPNFFEPYWYGDEGIYLTLGQAMRRGIKLYSQIIDHKTPLIYVISMYAYTLVRLRVVLLVASLANIILFCALARKLLKKNLTVYAATSFFALATTLPALEGNIANGEILLMPFTLGAMVLFWNTFPHQKVSTNRLKSAFSKTTPTIPLSIGALFALGVLLKVPSLVDAGALGITILFFIPHVLNQSLRKHSLRFAMYAALGFAAPIVFSIIYFWANGTLDAYYDFGLLYNFRYVQAWGSPFTHPVAVFLASMPGRLLMLASYTTVVWALRKKLTVAERFFHIWLGWTIFASTLSLRPYPHYFLQLIPPLSLILGSLLESKRMCKLLSIGTIAGLSIIASSLNFSRYPTLSYYQNAAKFITGNLSQEAFFSTFDQKTNNTYEVSQWLREHTEENDRIFIWGNEPMVYALSQRSPAGRYTVEFHISSFDAYEETIEALQFELPKYIIDYLHDVQSFSALYSLISKDYTYITTIGPARIYRILER